MLLNSRKRQEQIAALLESRQHCGVMELAQRFGVSDMTIRRDLRALADHGRAIRTHGGAAASSKVSFEFEFLRRRRTQESAKQAVGAAAAKLVRDGDKVLLDSGTTTLALAQHLKSKQNLTIITTSLPVASTLQFCAGVRVLLLGGYVRADSPDLIGALTEFNLEQLRADVAILGADAVDERGAVYHESPETSRLVAKMAAAAQRVYVVADSSKIGRTALMKSGSLSRWNGLVTDSKLPKAMAAALKRGGVQVIKAQRAERNGEQVE